MEELYKLKKMLCKELEQYGDRSELSPGSLEVIDKLSHSIKNICKIIEMYDEGSYAYEGGSYEGSYEDGGSMQSSRRGGSYARRRRRGANQYGSYARGYSRDDDLIEELRNLEGEAPNDQIKREIRKLVEKMENM